LRDRGIFDARMFFHLVFLFAPIYLMIGAAGCSSPKPAAVQPEQGPKRYAFSGRVVSIDKAKLQVVVDGDNIPGFMMAMTMGYAVKTPNLLDPLSPEDQIKADVVVNGNDVYLENIVVVKKADQAKTPPAGDAHPATPKPDKQ
jgi:protein SCO1/2